jgi:hypothetical protein
MKLAAYFNLVTGENILFQHIHIMADGFTSGTVRFLPLLYL